MNDGNNRKFEINQNRLNIEPRNDRLDATNIVALNDSSPIDLNMMSFLNNCKEIEEKIDTSQDEAIITKVGGEHSKFKELIKNRYNSLKMIKSYWEKSISSTISGLTM